MAAANKTERSAFIGAIFAYFLWGFTFMFSSIALRVADPPVMLAWRHLIAFAGASIMLLTGKVRISFRGKKLLPLFAMGLMEPVLYFFFESYGLLYTNTIFSGVMIALVPVVVLVLSAVFLREKPTLGQVLFSLLSIAGVAMLALQDTAEGHVRPLGVLLLLGAVLSTAVFSTLSRKCAAQYSAFERTYIMLGEGALVFTVSALINCAGDTPALFTPLSDGSFLGSVVFLGLVASLLCFLLVNTATTHVRLTRLSVLANLVTAVTVLAGVIFLNEPFTWLSAVCCVVILVGIFGVQKSERKPEALPDASR